MKVLMLGRTDIKSNPGGDLVQIEQTALELRKLGLQVDLKTTWHVDMSKYDLVHIFQLDWVSECFIYARDAKKAGKKVILSPIHHSIKEVELWEKQFAFGMRKIASTFLPTQFLRDTAKIVYRALFFDHAKLIPAFYAGVYGLKSLHKKTLELSDLVLVQTQAEVVDLKATYGVDFNWYVVPNGVGSNYIETTSQLAENTTPPLAFTDYILCVGRIEARKNQLSVIKAIEKLRNETNKDLRLVFVGRLSRTQKSYVTHFLNEVKSYDWITHLEWIDYSKMPSIYKFAAVSVSASWFETTGLTSLEALYCGCNAVASGSRAFEVLGDLVEYCDPANIDSIRDAIKKQLTKPKPILSNEFKRKYTWQKSAEKTLKLYNEVLND